MNHLVKTILAVVVLAALAAPATAGIDVFELHNHPDGALVPPPYGLRLDDIVGTGQFLFSFDYSDMTGSASVTLAYDDVAGTIHISGQAYGGKKVGSGWDPVLKGWIYIDFTYHVNVAEADDCPGSPGDDIYVTGADLTNSGTVTLMGWGGDAVLQFSDKANASGCTFSFDNDTDYYNNTTIANDLSIYSGTGWLMPEAAGGFRDWVFIGERMTVRTEENTWGAVKALYR
jgi:hypothetical protein